MEIKNLDSGWILLKINKECWAQIPKEWVGPIPDEYIFHPDWNRERINEAWLNYKAFAPVGVASCYGR